VKGIPIFVLYPVKPLDSLAKTCEIWIKEHPGANALVQPGGDKVPRIASVRRKLTAIAFTIGGLVCAAGPTAHAVDTSRSGTVSSPEWDRNIGFFRQGWNDTNNYRELFYYTSQGSRLIPYAWFVALERADSSLLMADPENMRSYGWIVPGAASPLNPDRLPIGFAKDVFDDTQNGGRSLGFNCAACHTGEVSFKGQTFRVDGGPAMADFGRFLHELSDAVRATQADPVKFDRFAGRVLGTGAGTQTARQDLNGAFNRFAAAFMAEELLRRPPVPAGPGRVDALGQILNALSVTNLNNMENYRPPNAPVSLPQVWYAPSLEWVQWDPIAANPIARNAGEALGVFGRAKLDLSGVEAKAVSVLKSIGELKQRVHALPPANHHNVPNAQPGKTATEEKALGSSVLFPALHDMEDWLKHLGPPPWREDVFGAIDPEKYRRGAALFDRECAGCHNNPPFRMTRRSANPPFGKQFVAITSIPYKEAGTDPLYVENLVNRTVKVGRLAVLFDEPKPVVPAAEFFVRSVGAITKKALADLNLTPAEKFEWSGYRFTALKPLPVPYSPARLDRMKAGPLVGMWATGPFLHNGSVPTIYDVISSPAERPRVFWVGGHELDVEKLGFVSTEAPGLTRFVACAAGTRDESGGVCPPGNSNQGHAFPRKPFTHEEKLAVLEYLKNPLRRVTVDALGATNSGLTSDQRREFHHGALGSELMPLALLKALTDPATDRPFLETVERFGMLLDPTNPDGLPVGITASGPPGSPRRDAGLNCAICHVGQMEYRGRAIRIDGAPNMFSMDGFMGGLKEALGATLRNPLRMKLLISNYRSYSQTGHAAPASGDIPAEAEARGLQVVIAQAAERISIMSGLAKAQKTMGKGTQAGPGRSDTFGFGHNLLLTQPDWVVTNAPDSFPDLWSHKEGDWLNWNGATTSGMERGVATVIGLFARFERDTGVTTVRMRELARADRIADEIKPPRWPDFLFGAIDPAKAAHGKEIFAKACASCHTTRAGTPITDVGTDPTFATRFAKPLADGKSFPETLSGLMRKYKMATYAAQGIQGDEIAAMEKPAPDVWRVTTQYVSKPLAGNWATAPYLHNGSVPTLYHLLLPPKQRPSHFPVGHREYDPVRLGYSAKAPAGTWEFDTSITGNSNGGHLYGTGLAETDRMALLEYLKGLGGEE
jgi:mono/diheme cytochrome c family protein